MIDFAFVAFMFVFVGLPLLCATWTYVAHCKYGKPKDEYEPNPNAGMKQIIVLRKDLNMRKGKMVAQGAHASMRATLENMDDTRVKDWLAGPFTKICVSVDSEEELHQIERAAREAGLITGLIKDAGRTEFNEPTYTGVAIGPDTHENLQPITGHLKLL